MNRTSVETQPPDATPHSRPGGEHFSLHLPPELRERVAAFARTGYPDETCGLLVGRSADRTTLIGDLVQTRNLTAERARDRYELAPEELLAADGAARERGLEIVGVWHSHPDHPAVPSVTDREKAWAGWSYLIASVGQAGLGDLRSWRLQEDEFVEEIIAPWPP